MKKDMVTIEEMDDGLWHIYNESGQRIEGDFETDAEAVQWAYDNSYSPVGDFMYERAREQEFKDQLKAQENLNNLYEYGEDGFCDGFTKY